MNVINIQNLCNYLEELGIVDQKSITPFLSLYSKKVNNYFNCNDSEQYNGKLESNIIIFEKVLCSYLKKIFNIEKNYKTFSHKIIEKFRKNILIKQYNGFFLLFYILSKKIKYSVINSYFNIKNYIFNNYESSTSTIQNQYNIKKFKNAYYESNDSNELNSNNYIKEHNNTSKKNIIINYLNDKGNGIINTYHDKKYNLKNIISLRNDNFFNNCNKKAKSLNNSINRMKRLIIQKNNNQKNKRIHKRIKSSNYNNIQLENKKNQFLSRIKKKHSINFKKNILFNNTNMSKINPNKNKENKNINYMEYNMPSSINNNEDSLFDQEQNDDEILEENNILTPSYNNNNYNDMCNIYHINKNKSTLDNKRSNYLIKYKKNEFNNDDEDNFDYDNDKDMSSFNSKHYFKNGKYVFNQNYIGLKNLKYKINDKNGINNYDNLDNNYYKNLIMK